MAFWRCGDKNCPQNRLNHNNWYFINWFNIPATIEKNDIDDLKEIKGIGPVIEKKLNMLGIVNFKQISELSDGALEQIAHTLKFFPGRIRRDHWVDQAKNLMKNVHRKS